MARTVNCVRLKKEAEGLTVPPLPGPKGQWVYENVSQEVWLQWQTHQTRLINEKRLNLLEPEARQYLTTQMDRFFAGEAVDAADGYVPEKK